MLGRLESPPGGTPAWLAELRDESRSRPITAHRLDEIVTHVFLRTVSRLPTPEELRNARADIARSRDPIDGVRDLLWVMLNTREFNVNH
jgi:hypothetical protein